MKKTWILLVMLLVGPWAGIAEPGPHERRGAEGHAESRKLLEEVLMARLTHELALDDGQAVLLLRHMTEFRDRMVALRRERIEAMRALRKAVRESKDEDQIMELMSAVRKATNKASAARNDVFDFDGFELTTWQRAKLMIFMSDFEMDMRRLLRRVQERRGGPGRHFRPKDRMRLDSPGVNSNSIDAAPMPDDAKDAATEDG